MSQSNTSEEMHKQFQVELQSFMKAMVCTWGELNIVHYMVVECILWCFVTPTNAFVSNMGCFHACSTSCMLMVRGSWTRTARLTCGAPKEWRKVITVQGECISKTHDMGVANKSNYLKEMFDWFFRYTFGRNLSREKAHMSKLAKIAKIQQKAKNKARWRAGTGPACRMAWRITRRRVGKVWVPMDGNEA